MHVTIFQWVYGEWVAVAEHRGVDGIAAALLCVWTDDQYYFAW